MADEGEFSKADGDIFFASEANRFAAAGRFLEVGSFAVVSSGAAEQTAGSIHIGTGSLSNPCSILFNYKLARGTQNTDVKIYVSGVEQSQNTSMFAGSSVDQNTVFGYGFMILGSPMAGMMRMHVYKSTGNNATLSTTSDRIAFNSVDNFNPGSEWVINFNLVNADSNCTFSAYNVQSFRGTI